jgi:TetR/AcrR family transcriptional regulator, transcriptional repressor for nem operon
MGRPREFDEVAVLDAAASCFWAAGYDGTSTRDLTRRMGLTPASLYNAFGDKRALFLRALDHYLETTLRARITQLEAALPPGQAIAAYLGGTVERSLADAEHRGCMLVNSALQATDPALQRVLAEEMILLEDFFHRCLAAGQRSGEIPDTTPARDGAQLLLSTLLGLRVLARVRPERTLLEAAVRQVLRGLDLPAPIYAPSPDQA